MDFGGSVLPPHSKKVVHPSPLGARGLSWCSLHVFFGYSGFLKQSKDVCGLDELVTLTRPYVGMFLYMAELVTCPPDMT